MLRTGGASPDGMGGRRKPGEPTVREKVPELAAFAESPPYAPFTVTEPSAAPVAVTEQLPEERLQVEDENVADPEPAVWLHVTVPVGEEPVTVAVQVLGEPTAIELGEQETDALDGCAPTMASAMMYVGTLAPTVNPTARLVGAELTTSYSDPAVLSEGVAVMVKDPEAETETAFPDVISSPMMKSFESVVDMVVDGEVVLLRLLKDGEVTPGSNGLAVLAPLMPNAMIVRSLPTRPALGNPEAVIESEERAPEATAYQQSKDQVKGPLFFASLLFQVSELPSDIVGVPSPKLSPAQT